MRKKEVTTKWVKENFITLRCGYCDLQYIMVNEPDYYNAGVYGWNCDFYRYGDIVISTGYRNMCGKDIPREIIANFNTIAKTIRNSDLSFNEKRNRLFDNQQDFLNWCTEFAYIK